MSVFVQLPTPQGSHKHKFDRANSSRLERDAWRMTSTIKSRAIGSFNESIALLKSMKLNMVESDIYHCNNILSSMIRSCKLSDWHQSLQLLSSFACDSCADTVSYNSAMRCLPWRTSLALFTALKKSAGCTFSDAGNVVISYNSFISSFKESQDGWQQSQHVLMEMQWNQVKMDHFTFMAASKKRSLGGPASWQKSFELTLDLLAWNSVLAARRSESTWQTPLHLLQLMFSLGLLPDIVSYHSCLQQDMWQLTLSLMKSADRMSLDIITMNSAMSSLGSGEWFLAHTLLESTKHRRLLPNALSLNTFLHCMSKGKRWQTAMKLFHDGLGLRRDSFSLTSVITGIGWQKGLALLQEVALCQQMNLEAAIPSNAALNACAQASEWQKALRLLDHVSSICLTRLGRADDSDAHAQALVSFGTAINTCGKNLRWQHALWLLFAQMPLMRVERDLVCCTAAVSACEKGSQWKHALSLLAEMPPSRIYPSPVTLNAVISACGKASQWAEALFVLKLSGSDADVVSYNAATCLQLYRQCQ